MGDIENGKSADARWTRRPSVKARSAPFEPDARIDRGSSLIVDRSHARWNQGRLVSASCTAKVRAVGLRLWAVAYSEGVRFSAGR